MSTETKGYTSSSERTGTEANPTATSDNTKVITAGCGCALLVDASRCNKDVTVTFATRADPSGRTEDPAAFNPITVAGGTMKVDGGRRASLYGQGANGNDLEFAVAVNDEKWAAPTQLELAEITGGSLPAGTYYYSVSALSVDGETEDSEVVSIETQSQYSGKVNLSWEKVVGAQAYRVYRGTSQYALNYLKTVIADPCLQGSTIATFDDGNKNTSDNWTPLASGTAQDKAEYVVTVALQQVIVGP